MPAANHAAGTRYWKSLLIFTGRNLLLLLALIFGIAGATGCFAFTYWLSLQIFYCPPWTINCEVHKAVHWFANRLGFVQGFLSSIYGICIAMIAYAAYQYAETTIWPALTQHALTLSGIDCYLAHARGSLPSFPLAAWHARKPVSSWKSTLHNALLGLTFADFYHRLETLRSRLDRRRTRYPATSVLYCRWFRLHGHFSSDSSA